MQIGQILYNKLNENGREIYHRVSISSDKYDKTEKDSKYSSFESDKEDKMTIETLKYYTKWDDPKEYFKFYKSNN